MPLNLSWLGSFFGAFKFSTTFYSEVLCDFGDISKGEVVAWYVGGFYFRGWKHQSIMYYFFECNRAMTYFSRWERGKYTRSMPRNFNLNIGTINKYIKNMAYNIDFRAHMYIKVFAQQPSKLKIWLSRSTP